MRDRASYQFALVSVAAALDIGDDGTVRDAAGIGQASDILLAGNVPLAHNGFKVELARRSIARALQTAAAQGAAS